jgi:hypothetical protein
VCSSDLKSFGAEQLIGMGVERDYDGALSHLVGVVCQLAHQVPMATMHAIKYAYSGDCM